MEHHQVEGMERLLEEEDMVVEDMGRRLKLIAYVSATIPVQDLRLTLLQFSFLHTGLRRRLRTSWRTPRPASWRRPAVRFLTRRYPRLRS